MTFSCHLQARVCVCIPPLLPPSPPGAHSILGATGRVGCSVLHCLDAAKLCYLKVSPPPPPPRLPRSMGEVPDQTSPGPSCPSLPLALGCPWPGGCHGDADTPRGPRLICLVEVGTRGAGMSLRKPGTLLPGTPPSFTHFTSSGVLPG